MVDDRALLVGNRAIVNQRRLIIHQNSPFCLLKGALLVGNRAVFVHYRDLLADERTPLVDKRARSREYRTISSIFRKDMAVVE